MECFWAHTLRFYLALMLDFIFGLWMIHGALKYIQSISPRTKIFIQGVVREQHVWYLYLGWAVLWERTLVAPHFFPDPEGILSLKLSFAGDPSSVPTTQRCACCWGSQELLSWITPRTSWEPGSSHSFLAARVYKYHQCTVGDLNHLCRITDGKAAAETYL